VIIGLTTTTTKDLNEILEFIRSKGYEIEDNYAILHEDDVTRIGSYGEFLISGRYDINITLNSNHLTVKNT